VNGGAGGRVSAFASGRVVPLASGTTGDDAPDEPGSDAPDAPEVVSGNAPAWPVRPGASSLGDEGSDFLTVWRNGAFHADHTGYLRLFDEEPAVLFLRPQRFGKTLWLSIMYYYYDVNYADSPEKIEHNEPCFSTLFGGAGNDYGPLAIARDKTRNLQNSFYVLKLVLPKTYDVDNHRAAFRKSINSQVAEFLLRHSEVIDAWNRLQSKLRRAASPIVDDDDYVETLRRVQLAVNERLSAPLMVLVDECDRAPMTGLCTREAKAGPMTPDERYLDAMEASRGFFGWLKDMVNTVPPGVTLGNRYFVTGITPISLTDSIFNGYTSLTFSPPFANLLGFTEDEVRGVLEHVARIPKDSDEFKEAFELMKRCYNGYFFAGANEATYNPQLVLYFAENYQTTFKGSISTAELTKGRGLASFSDMRQEISPNQVALVSAIPQISTELLRTRLDGPPLSMTAEERLSLADLDAKPYLFLHYLGVLTLDSSGIKFTGDVDLVVPNAVTRLAYSQAYAQAIMKATGSMSRFVNDPTVDNLKSALKSMLSNLDAQRVGKDNEPLWNSLICAETISVVLPLDSDSFSVDTQADPDLDGGNLRTDLQFNCPTVNERVVQELKNVPPSNMQGLQTLNGNAISADDLLRHIDGLDEAQRRTALKGITLLSGKYQDGKTKATLTTVDALHESAQRQALRYMQKAAQGNTGGRKIRGFAVTKVGQFFLVDEVFLKANELPTDAASSNYESLPTNDLKAELKRRELKVSGKKEDLIERLKQNDAGCNYESWKKNRLKDELKRRGLKVSGTKEDLIDRLKQDDADK